MNHWCTGHWGAFSSFTCTEDFAAQNLLKKKPVDTVPNDILNKPDIKKKNSSNNSFLEKKLF